MLKNIFLTAFISMAITSAWAAPMPRHATQLDRYVPSAKVGTGLMRMRISVAGDAGQAASPVRVGDVILCSMLDCYRARSAGFTHIAGTAAGTASTLAEVVIPVTTITDVYFGDMNGSAVLAGHLTLPEPLAIAPEFQAVELMIVVSRRGNARQAQYVPTQSASMYFNDESELVRYVPAVETVAKLSLGTVVTIPAGALAKPQIFNIGVMNVGRRFPIIDMFPYLELLKPASVETSAVENVSAVSMLAFPAAPATTHPRTVAEDGARPAGTTRVVFSRTSLIDPSALQRTTRKRN